MIVFVVNIRTLLLNSHFYDYNTEFLENTLSEHDLQYRSILEDPSASYTTSHEGIPPQMQQGDTFVNFLIICFLISSVVLWEDMILFNSSKFSLGISSSLIVPLSGLIPTTNRLAN